jgi:hypothetical protein
VVFYASHGPSQTGAVPLSPLLSAASLRDRIQELRPTLPQSAPAFKAAVLLLAAQQIGQNIDRLARFTGYPREFIARCARRLCDNGVWQDSRTVTTWSVDNLEENAFWADAGVAEGSMCRRVDRNGSIEWARAGVWIKSYDYVEQEPRPGLSVQYFSCCGQADAAPESDKNILNNRDTTPHTTSKGLPARTKSRTLAASRAADRTATVLESTRDAWTPVEAQGWSSAERTHCLPQRAPHPELFADAIWLM